MSEKRGQQPGGREPLPPAKPALSAGRRRLFWALTLLLPLGVLAGAELILRAVGLGYPTHFFVSARDGTPGWYAENPRFGWRFFPRRLARAPDPVRVTRHKAPGTCRILVFGESAALGDPELAYGFSRILRELLEERCPGTRFEVLNVGMTAINSHVIRCIAEDCAGFDADLWILYMGNNEVVGPFGAGSIFGLKAPPLPITRLFLAARRMRIGQVLEGLLERPTCAGGSPRIGRA